MARQRSIHDTYTGRAGQLAVMAELLMRKRNVAIPEVDVGEDVLAFISGQEVISRLQVKTANARALKAAGRYSARVSVPLRQLRAADRPTLYYAFPVRLEDRWMDFLFISRYRLKEMSTDEGVGYLNATSGELELSLSFGPDDVT
jgi:hypothetical protein